MRSFSRSSRGRGRGLKKKQEDSTPKNESNQGRLEIYSRGRGRGKARGRAPNARGRAAFGFSHRGTGKLLSSTHLEKDTGKSNAYGKQLSKFQEEDDTSSQNRDLEEFEAHSYGIVIADEIQNDSTNHFDNDNGKDKIKVKLIRGAEVQLKEEDNNTGDGVELAEEALYVPHTRDLDSSLVKDQLLQKISLMKDLAGFNISLQTKGEQMFVLIKHNDDDKLHEAKKKIVTMMQSIIAEMRNVSTSDQVKADAIDHSTSDDFDNSGTDLRPLLASSEDFLSIMSSGGPESDDQPVYGFLTNIPRGVVAKDLHSAIIDNYRKKAKYSGPDFPFLSMFNFVDRSLTTKFCAAKFPSRKILKDVIKQCSPVKRQTFTAHIKQVPPEDPKIKAIAGCIRTVLQVSLSNQKISSATSSPDCAAPAPAQRPRGVFPAGVQPEKVVVVIDDAIPHLNVEEIRKKGYDVLTGSNLDVHGFFELIAGDDHYRNDGVLYVVQPGLDFFLKNMKAMDLGAANFEKSESLVADPKKFANHLSTLITKNFERSLSQKKNPSKGIFNFSSESLTVLNKCDLSKLGKLGEFPCSTTSSESCHEDLDHKNQPLSNNGPAKEEVSNNQDTCSSPLKSNEEDDVLVSGHLETFVSRALQLALALRNMILVNTLNCEVVFLGFPVEWLLADEAQKVFPKMPETSLKHLTGSLITSLCLFNIFAGKTWKLGGFPSLDFNNDPAVSGDECVHETKKLNIKSRLGALVVNEPVKGSANTTEGQEETNKECKDESTTEAIETEDIGGERSAEDDLMNCSDDALIYEDDADDDDEDGNWTQRSKFVSEKDSSKCSYLDDTAGSCTTRQTETEVIDLDAEDQEQLLCELESEGDAIECLDVEAIAAAAAKKTSCTGTSGGSHDDFLDLSLLKQVCVINRDVTADVTRVLDFVSEHYKINGCFAPWTPIKGAPCNPSSHLPLVKEYVKEFFYTKVKQHKGPDMYLCTAACNSMKLMDAAEAEAHIYTRCHITKLANQSKKGPLPARIPAKRLLFEGMMKCGTPVASDQIENLVKLGIVEQLEIGGEQRFKCLLCPKLPAPCNGVFLRTHLHSYAHLKGLINSLGTGGCLTVPIIENWRTIKRALRHSATDVVIVADNMHRPALTAFIDMHPQVHVITVSNLIYEGSAPGKVLSGWRKIEEAQKSANKKPAHTFFLIVTGKDLMYRPSQAPSDAQTSSDFTNQHAKEKVKPEEEVEEVNDEMDVVYQSGCGDGAMKSSEGQQNIQWNNLLQHFDKTIKESVTALVRLHSFFRVQLPVDCKVLVAPSLPLTVLSDTTPQPAKANLLQHMHTVVVPPHLTQAMCKAYSKISEEVYSIHKANSVHENLPHVDKTLALNPTEVAEKRYCLLSSQWHVTVEEIVLNALRGMPAVIPNFTAEDEIDIKQLGLHTNLNQGVVVGDYAEWIQHTSKSNNKFTGYSGRGMSMFARALRFHKADMDFILEKAKLLAEDAQKSFVWYLTCPIPEILFYPKECKMCISSGCDTPLKVWAPANVHRYKCDDESLDRVSNNALMKVSKFMTLLQSKLPPKHFVTLFPIFPTNMISFGSINNTVHDEMHKLQYDVPRTIFSPMPVTEVLKPIAHRFANGWLELFRKVHLGHTESFDPRSFKNINVQHIRMKQRFLAHNSMKGAEFWLSAVNSLIWDHHIKFEVEITPAISAWLQGERSGPSPELALLGNREPERADCRELLNRIKRHDHQEPPAFNKHQPPFNRVDEGRHGHMGPRGRSFSPVHRSRSPQFGGPPIRRDGPAPYLTDPAAPPSFTRCDSPRMRSRSPFQRRGSPPVQGFDPAAMRSRSPCRMNPHLRSKSPSHGSRASMRLDDQPHPMRLDDQPHHKRLDDPPHHMRLNNPPHHLRLDDPSQHMRLDDPPHLMRLDDPPHHMRLDGLSHQNPEGRNFDRPQSNQERRPRSPERCHYSPGRDMDHCATRHSAGEGPFSNCTDQWPRSTDRKRFSPEPQHSSRGRFHSSPPRTRFSHDRSEGPKPWESSFPKTVASFGGTPSGPATSQFVFTVATASRKPLSQHWINKLAWAFKISAQPTPGPRGSWRVQAPSARVLFGAQRFLPAVRLVDQQLIVAVETSHSAVVPVTSLEEEELYRQQLEFVVRCYNDDRTPNLVSLLKDDTAATFFRPGWEHLYIPDLSRTIPLVADAMRSLRHIPRSEAGSVRLLVVTPSADAVGVMMRVLQTIAGPLGITVVPIIHGKEDVGPGMTVVVGAAIPLAHVCPGLILQDLSALVVDDATVFLDDPTPKEALLSVLSRIGTRTRDFTSVNKVAVAREDTAAERSRMEAMLECVFAGGCGPPQQSQPRLVEGVGPWEEPWLQQVNEMQQQFQSYLQKQKKLLPPEKAQFQERSQEEHFTSKQKHFGSGQELNEGRHKLFNPRHEQFKSSQEQWESPQDQLKHQQAQFGSEQNQFKTQQEPSGSRQNRFEPPQEQFGPKQGKFGSRQNQLKSQQEAFRSGQNQFKPQQEQFGTRQNQSQSQQDQFGSGPNRVQPHQENLGSQQNQFKPPQQDQFESQQEQSGSWQNHFHPQQKQFGPNQNRFEPQQEKFGSRQNQFKPQQKQSGSRQNQFEPQQEFGSRQNQFKPHQEELGSRQNQFKPQKEEYGSRQNQFKPQQEKFEPQQNQFKPQQEEFGSKQNQFKPQQEEFGSKQNQFKPQQGHFEPRQNQFKSQHEQSGSSQKLFKPQQEQFGPKHKRFKAQQKEFGSRQNQFEPQQEKFGSRQNQFKPQQEQYNPQLEKFKAPHEQFFSRQKQSTSQQTPFEMIQQQASTRLLPRSTSETSPQVRGLQHQHSPEVDSQGPQFGYSTSKRQLEIPQTRFSPRGEEQQGVSSFMPGRQETSSSDYGNRLSQSISDFLERRKAGAVNLMDTGNVVSLEYLSNLTKTQLEQVPKMLLKELYATLFKDKLDQTR